MTRKTSAMVTTAAVSMALGTAAYMASTNKGTSMKAKKFKKSTGKALKQVSDFIDNMSYMMR